MFEIRGVVVEWSLLVYCIIYKGGKVTVLTFVMVQGGVHGSDVDHMSFVSTCMNELLVPH